MNEPLVAALNFKTRLVALSTMKTLALVVQAVGVHFNFGLVVATCPPFFGLSSFNGFGGLLVQADVAVAVGV